MITTSLYEKVFIDGFEKPSYVVATIALPRLPENLVESIKKTVELHPRLRSVIRFRFGVPTDLEPRPTSEWLEAGGGLTFVDHVASIPAFEEQLLSTPTRMPLAVHAIRGPRPHLVLKIHHAFIDASSGFKVLHDFARMSAGLSPAPPPSPSTRIRRQPRFRDWVRQAQLRPRLPSPSFATDFTPTLPLEQMPVVYVERIVRQAPIARLARQHGATFSEIVTCALLSAMTAKTEKVGLMIAKARPRASTSEAAFRAETCVVDMDRGRPAHDPSTLSTLRERMRDPRHNDVALAMLYAMRKLRPPTKGAVQNVRNIYFTLSDITAFRSSLHDDVRVLASPTSFDHAGMIVSRAGPHHVRFAVVAHRGALDGHGLLTSLFRNLEITSDSTHERQLPAIQA